MKGACDTMNSRAQLTRPFFETRNTYLPHRECACGTSKNRAGEYDERRYGEGFGVPSRAPNHTEPTVGSRSVQEALRSPGELQTVGGKEYKKEQTTLHRNASNPAKLNAVRSVVRDVLSSPGQSLDVATRPFKESQYDRSTDRSHSLQRHR
jgi:hypothetical protein